MMKRKPSNEAAALDPITSLQRAIMQGQEDAWAHHAVPLEERARLRPAVAKIAQAVTDRMREEHAARTAQP
ncbi:MAG: hypothetical protein M3545_18005 [Acidobacteriota bacterium]|nr:hypothetical protein [Acidobacteriota bacterium]